MLLGRILAWGSDTDARDPEEALGHYLDAAAAGDAGAMGQLGMLYARGVSGEPDWGEAIRWMKRAAERGEARGLYGLGMARFR